MVLKVGVTDAIQVQCKAIETQMPRLNPLVLVTVALEATHSDRGSCLRQGKRGSNHTNCGNRGTELNYVKPCTGQGLLVGAAMPTHILASLSHRERLQPAFDQSLTLPAPLCHL